MIFSTAIVVSVLSLLSFTRAATIHVDQNNCTFVCPDKDLKGDALNTSTICDVVISCSYFGKAFKSCAYNTTSGTFVGDGDSRCPKRAAKHCVKHRSWGGVPGGPADTSVEWKHDGFPGPDPKRDVPPPTSVWSPYDPSPSWSPSPSPSWSPSPSPSWSPSPSPSWNPSPSKPKPSQPPSTPQPCKFRCPQQDLAKNPLTDEAIREPYLFCSYPAPQCKTCSFCKYSTKTGLLLEDNDDGNCPKTASVARPWDRRFA